MLLLLLGLADEEHLLFEGAVRFVDYCHTAFKALRSEIAALLNGISVIDPRESRQFVPKLHL